MDQIKSEVDKHNTFPNASPSFDNRFRTLVEDLSTGVIVYDSNNKIIYSNHAALVLLGLNMEQMWTSFTEDHGQCFLRDDKTLMPFEEHPVSKACRSGEAFDNQVIGVLRPDRDAPVWILGSARPEFYFDGKISQVIFNFSDITYEKELKEKLSEQKILFDVALNQTHAGIIIVDARSKKIKHLNHAGGLMFGVGAIGAEGYGENLDITKLLSAWEMVQLDGTPLSRDEVPLLWAIAHGKEMSKELILKRPGFAERTVWMDVTPISKPDETLVAVVGIIFDTTIRYNLEKDIIGLKELAEMKARFLDIASADRQFY